MSISVANFQNPWSARTISPIDLHIYSDGACIADRIQKKIVDGMVFKQLRSEATAANYTTSSKIVGDQSLDNTLTVSYAPLTTFSKTGSGEIQIYLPDWFVNDGFPQSMYPDSARD